MKPFRYHFLESTPEANFIADGCFLNNRTLIWMNNKGKQNEARHYVGKREDVQILGR